LPAGSTGAARFAKVRPRGGFATGVAARRPGLLSAPDGDEGSSRNPLDGGATEGELPPLGSHCATDKPGTKDRVATIATMPKNRPHKRAIMPVTKNNNEFRK
jgi:hypothetical protein